MKSRIKVVSSPNTLVVVVRDFLGIDVEAPFW